MEPGACNSVHIIREKKWGTARDRSPADSNGGSGMTGCGSDGQRSGLEGHLVAYDEVGVRARMGPGDSRWGWV